MERFKASGQDSSLGSSSRISLIFETYRDFTSGKWIIISGMTLLSISRCPLVRVDEAVSHHIPGATGIREHSLTTSIMELGGLLGLMGEFAREALLMARMYTRLHVGASKEPGHGAFVDQLGDLIISLHLVIYSQIPLSSNRIAGDATFTDTQGVKWTGKFEGGKADRLVPLIDW